MVLGVDAPGAGHAALHGLMVAQDRYDALPHSSRDHSSVAPSTGSRQSPRSTTSRVS
jgi:hypothetical protein